MKKLKLALEDLAVDSFEAAAAGTPGGTVDGHLITAVGGTCVETCYRTCKYTCGVGCVG